MLITSKGKTSLWIAAWLAWTAQTATAVALEEEPRANASAAATRVELNAQVELVDGEISIAGQVRITGWSPANGHCLYVPYSDPDYGLDRGQQRRLDNITGSRSVSTFYGGDTTVAISPPARVILAPDHPGIVRLALPPGFGVGDEIVVRYRSLVPKQEREYGDDKIFDGFYPMPLAACPSLSSKPLPLLTEITASVELPKGYDYAGPVAEREPERTIAKLVSRTFVFGMSPDFRMSETKAGNVPVTIYHHTQGFLELEETIRAAMPLLEAWLGPFPYDGLTVIETSELQRHALPAVIALNRPRQALFQSAQQQFLNWNHWMIVRLLAMQWFGASITVEDPRDEWLLSGTVDFVAEEVLRQIPERYDLFAADKDGYRFVSLTFLEQLEYSAASLRRFAPFATLTDASLKTAEPRELQHPLLYVKHALALRQLRHAAGELAFSGFFRNLTSAYRGRTLSPKDFFAFLSRLPSPFPPLKRQELQKSLALWWTREGWPDFVLTRLESRPLGDGRYSVIAEARQTGEVDFVPEFAIRDVTGTEHFVRAVRPSPQEDALWRAETVIGAEPVSATVDPRHEGFDEDRFDNDTEPPKLAFFPGSAKNLAPDAYTVIWVPYPFKRPAEPPGLGIQGAVFRYIYGGLFYQVEVAPKERQTSYKVRHRYQQPSYAIHGDLQIEQEFEGDRQIEATLVRSPLFPGPLDVSLQLSARRKQRVGQPESAHVTGAFGFSLKPAGEPGACTFALAAEVENAPAQFAEDFAYERKLASLLGMCGAGRFSLALRGFWGRLYKEGTPPEQAYFKPTELKEAQLTLDIRGLERVRQIMSVGADLHFPLPLPLPDDSLVLSRRLQGKLYYDWGVAPIERHVYRAAGAGIVLPFGGDLAGAGSISFTRMTLLVSLYSRVDDEVSRKPSVLFDATGEL